MSVYETSSGYVVADADERLGEGGRGMVLAVLGDTTVDASGRERRLACKVFAKGYRTSGRRRKVERLIELGKQGGANVAWPLETLSDDGEWVGYVMRRAEGETLDELCARSETPLKLKVDLAARACDVLSSMHGLGVVVGDVGMGNFMYCAASDELVLIDVDSAQVTDPERQEVFPVAESLEKSPEMLEQGLGNVVLTSRSDDFLAAVMVFRMLFGAHPLDSFKSDALPAEVRADNARRRRFPYASLRGVLPVTAFGEELGELFEQSFSGAYERIPKASAYAKALRRVLAAGFSTCDACEMTYARAAGACPRCFSASGSGRVSLAFLAFLLAWALFTANIMGFDAGELGEAALDALVGMADAAGEAAAWAVGAIDGISELASGAIDGVGDLMTDAIDGASELGGFAEDALDSAAHLAESAFVSVDDLISDVLSGIVSAAS